MNRPVPIPQIDGVPPELTTAINNRLRVMQQGAATSIQEVAHTAAVAASSAAITAGAPPAGSPAQPHALILSDTGIRSLDQNQTTYATLQVIIQEAVAGPLGTILNLEYSNNGGTGWTALPTAPTAAPDRAHEDATHTYYQTTIQFKVLVLAAAQSIQVGAWAANKDVDPGATFAVLSNVLTLPAIASPIAGGATIAVTTVGGLTATPVAIYMGLNGAGNPYWAVNVTVTTPLNGDPNCAFYQACVEWCNSSGTPINPGGVGNTSGWIKNQEFANTGQTYVEPVFVGNYAGPGVDAYCKFSLWGLNRANTANTPPYTGDPTATLQTSTVLLHVGPPPTGNSANMLANPSALQPPTVGWTEQATGTYSQVSNSSLGVAVECFQIVASGAAGMSQSFAVRQGDTYLFDVWAAVTAGAGSGAVDLHLIFLNASGGVVSTSTTNVTSLLTATLQQFALQGIVPTGAVTMQASFDCTGATSTLIFTNALLAQGVATGGGIALVNGVVVGNLGYTMGLNGSGQMVVANLPTVAGLPSLPSSAYPAGSVVCDTLSGTDPSTGLATPAYTLYRNPSGSQWVASQTPTDLVAGAICTGVTLAAAQITAGTLISGVVYAGSINCSQLQAGTISVAVSLTSPTITVTSGGVTTTLGPAALNSVFGTGAYGIESASSNVMLAMVVTTGTYPGGSFTICNGAGTATYATLSYTSLSGYGGLELCNAAVTEVAFLCPFELQITNLPSSSPGAGTKQFWYDPSDSNRVKFAS